MVTPTGNGGAPAQHINATSSSQMDDCSEGARQAAREKHRASTRRWYERHREERSVYNRTWRVLHKADRQAYWKTWRKEHPDEYKERTRTYYLSHKTERAAYNRARNEANHETLKPFSGYLAELVKSYPGYKQDVAHALGVSPSMLSHYLAGNRKPNEEVLQRMASLFRVPHESLAARLSGDLPTCEPIESLAARLATKLF